MAVDSTSFRDALGRFVSGVTVVTCFDRDRRPAGLTVSAFSSLSLDPPLILICLARGGQCLDVFLRAVGFAVNILSADQRDLSVRFSSLPAAERFRDLPWDSWSHGGPALPGAVAALDCRRARVVEGGDHLILIGEVEAIRLGDAPAPLVYHRGGYRRLAAD